VTGLGRVSAACRASAGASGAPAARGAANRSTPAQQAATECELAGDTVAGGALEPPDAPGEAASAADQPLEGGGAQTGGHPHRGGAGANRGHHGAER